MSLNFLSQLSLQVQHLPAGHNVALVFTRCILNNADYTPIGFSNPCNTTWTHQLAAAYAITSPLITMAENPAMLLEDERLKRYCHSSKHFRPFGMKPSSCQAVPSEKLPSLHEEMAKTGIS
jgi:hypothetical protein